MAFLTWLYQQEMTSIATPTMAAEVSLLGTGIGLALIVLLTVVYLVNRRRQPGDH
jgi:hypothetical protein